MTTKSLTDVPEQNHEAMRAAAERPINGPAATSTLAAGGGLEVPGGERHDNAPPIGIGPGGDHEPIPGEYDATTRTHREPGAIGGAFNGADNVSQDAGGTLSQEDRTELFLEGGGRDGERILRKQGDK